MSAVTYHIAMFPWFALGHLTPFLHLSNKLAKIGHRISFLIPAKTQHKLEAFNLHPQLISFIPLTVPQVDGLPRWAETTSDVPQQFHTLIMTAMDRTQKDVEIILKNLKVDIVFFDFTHWIPDLADKIGIKSLHYSIITPVTVGYALSPERKIHGLKLSETDLMGPPAGFPLSSIKLCVQEAHDFAARTTMKFGGDISFFDRLFIGLSQCDAMGYSTCRELDGPFCDYLESQFQKPVLLFGPPIPVPPNSTLDERWVKWLARFKEGSVIYCALGSECILSKDQFQELIRGFELTGLPYFAALKPPIGYEPIEEALPEEIKGGFERKGLIHGGWVQQQLILKHPSVGCFVTHCGWASLSEALVNKCQLVLLPKAGDQIIHAKIMSTSLKVGIEVERGEENGSFTKEGICKAVRTVMDQESKVGKEVRENHDKLREILLSKDLETSYINSCNVKLQNLLA